MIRGGIHDHVGGGFHRYAVDNEWAVPHFEKMLYNQALVAAALRKAYELTGRRRYADALRKTLDFVLARMTVSGGAFASAFDAETDGHEGLFYVWTRDEIEKVLGADAPFAIQAFGITDEGNLEGRNTVRLVEEPEDLAEAMKLKPAEFQERLARVLKKLKSVRDKRKPLRRDDKVLTGWNAMMIRAMAQSGRTLNEPRYVDAAVKAQQVIMSRLGGEAGALKRSYFEGKAELPATQTDYALTGLALVALADITGDTAWLDHAGKLAKAMIARFEDKNCGRLLPDRSRNGLHAHEGDQRRDAAVRERRGA